MISQVYGTGNAFTLLRECGQQAGCARARYHGVTQPVRGVEIKNEWIYTFSLPYIFMTFGGAILLFAQHLDTCYDSLSNYSTFCRKLKGITNR